MTEKILFVDDEPQLLQAIKRQLRKRFTIYTAESGNEALEKLKEEGPFAVIVSDMRMPGMDGVQLLSMVKDSWPDTVRLMLTGNADQETAADAVNKGQIFRFLNKPCSTAVLAPALALALRQYKLITVEKELLDETLKGSIDVMTELLTRANATAFSVGLRIKPLVKKLAIKMELPGLWQYEIAACLSQIGCITLPSEIIQKVHSGQQLSEDEWQTFKKHPATGGRLISQIPRLEKISEMIFLQLREYKNFEEDSEIEEDVALGAHILKAAIEYDLLRQQDLSHSESLESMRERKNWYNPEVLMYLTDTKPPKGKMEARIIQFQDVIAGMVADENVMAKNGTLIIPKGQKITWSIIEGLANFKKHIGIEEPFRVLAMVR